MNKIEAVGIIGNGFVGEAQAFAFAPWKRNNFPCYNCIFPNQHSNTTEQSCDSMGIVAPVAGLGPAGAPSSPNVVLSGLATNPL